MNNLVPRMAAAVVAAVFVACGLWGISQGTGLPDPTTTEHQPGQRTRAVVVRVVDGDTVRVKTRSGRVIRIRVLGISAPEIPHPGEPEECYGGRASRHLADLLPVGSSVVLETDPTQATGDAYGRLLRYIETGGRDVGLAQIRSGAATAREGIPPVQRIQEYREAQAQAEEYGRGVWSACE